MKNLEDRLDRLKSYSFADISVLPVLEKDKRGNLENAYYIYISIPTPEFYKKHHLFIEVEEWAQGVERLEKLVNNPAATVSTFQKDVPPFDKYDGSIRRHISKEIKDHLKIIEWKAKLHRGTVRWGGYMCLGIGVMGFLFAWGSGLLSQNPDPALGTVCVGTTAGLIGFLAAVHMYDDMKKYKSCYRLYERLEPLKDKWEREGVNYSVTVSDELTELADAIFNRRDYKYEYLHSSLNYSGARRLIKEITKPSVSTHIDQQTIETYLNLVKNSEEQKIEGHASGFFFLFGSFSVDFESKPVYIAQA